MKHNISIAKADGIMHIDGDVHVNILNVSEKLPVNHVHLTQDNI